MTSQAARVRRANPDRIRRNLRTKREANGCYRVVHGEMRTGYYIQRNDNKLSYDKWSLHHDAFDVTERLDDGYTMREVVDIVAKRIANVIPWDARRGV